MKIYAAVFAFSVINIVSSQAAFAQLDINTGLVAHFGFNGNANDVRTSQRRGVVHSAEMTNDRNGKSEHAYFFDRTERAFIADMNDEQLPSGASLRTISAWIKTPPNAPEGYTIVDYGRMDRNSNCHLGIDKGVIRLGFWANDVDGVIAVDDDHWHHVAGVWDGKVVTIYVDGRVDISRALDNPPETILNGSLTIGVTNNKKWHHFNGSIDDIRIYNRALSKQDITTLYSED